MFLRLYKLITRCALAWYVFRLGQPGVLSNICILCFMVEVKKWSTDYSASGTLPPRFNNASYVSRHDNVTETLPLVSAGIPLRRDVDVRIKRTTQTASAPPLI